MGYSKKLRFYDLDHESKMRLLKTHSHTSNRLAMEPGTREETQTQQQVNSHPSKTCRMPPVWRGKNKGSRICRISPVWRGGQERLYGKTTTEKVLWRGEPSSIWRGTQAPTQGRTHAKNLPRAIGKAGGSTRKRQIPGMEGGNTHSPARGGSV